MIVLPRLAGRIFGVPLAIERTKLDVIVTAIGPRLKGAQMEAPPADRPVMPAYASPGGIAVIDISGTLVSRATGMEAESGLMSYADIATAFSAAMADPEIQGILLSIDSPGGEVQGMFELADMMYSARGQKPICAMVDCAASAAYMLASAADEIVISRTALVGSIGVIALHLDESKADEQAGLKYTAIYAGDRKNDGNPHEPLSPEARGTLQDRVDKIYGMFVSAAARNRGMSEAAIRKTEAAVYMGSDGVDAGLADRLGATDDAVSLLQAGIANSARRNAMPAIAVHHTATADGPWDGPANEARLPSEEQPLRTAHAWVEANANPAAKNSYKFIHHDVGSDGKPGAANLAACSAAIAVLNGGRGGADIPEADRQGVYDHLAAHLKDAGKEPPKLEGAPFLLPPEALERIRNETFAAAAEIVDVCAIAGVPASASDFIRARKSVAEVRADLLARRVNADKPFDLNTGIMPGAYAGGPANPNPAPAGKAKPWKEVLQTLGFIKEKK